MNPNAAILSLLLLSPLALAQNCPNRNFGAPLGTGDDTIFAMQPIGFAFPFAGTTYTNIHVCANGYVHLSNSGVPTIPATGDFSATAAELASGAPRICALWTDFNVLAAANGQVWLDSTPTTCTVTWENVVNYGGAGVVAGPIQTIQLQLASNGEIKVFYSANATNNSSLTAGQHGIVGASPGGGATLPAASDLSLGGTTIDPTLFEEWTVPVSFDLGGKVLQMVPANPGWGFVPSTPSNCAAVADYGTGCLNQDDSFYEMLSGAAFDLNGKTFTMLRNQGGYTVLDGVPGVFFTPTTGATPVAQGDDTVTSVTLSLAMPCPGGTTNTLEIGSNGYVATGANGVAIQPSVATFLNWPNSVFSCWRDLNPLAGGQLTFEESAGISYVTYDNVVSYNTTAPNTFQFQFDLATGNVTLLIVTMASSGTQVLVGYSTGGASADHGSMDLSSAFAAGGTIYDAQLQPLRLTTGGLPYLGTTSYSLEISNIPNVAPLAVLFFGTAQLPGVPLAVIGMAGCSAYTNADAGSVTVAATLPAGTASQPFPIPSNPALAGIALSCQALAFSTSTQLGLVASNGTLMTVGF